MQRRRLAPVRIPEPARKTLLAHVLESDHERDVRPVDRGRNDLENGDLRKTSFTTLTTGENVYRYSYTVDPIYSFSVRTRF